jgi:hypothetical protein
MPCALARPHLSNPYWTLHAAGQLGYEAQHWANQYLSGRQQYLRNLQRAADMAISIRCRRADPDGSGSTLAVPRTINPLPHRGRGFFVLNAPQPQANRQSPHLLTEYI